MGCPRSYDVWMMPSVNFIQGKSCSSLKVLWKFPLSLSLFETLEIRTLCAYKCTGYGELLGPPLFLLLPIIQSLHVSVCICMSLSSSLFESSLTLPVSIGFTSQKTPCFLFFPPPLFLSLLRAWSWKLGFCVV